MAEDFDSLLGLLRRTTDEFGWLQPLLDDVDSAAILGGEITVFARLGAAVDHNGAQAMIATASGGSPGTSSLTISRPASGTTGTIPEGYVFVDPRGCQAFLTSPIVVGSGALSAVLPLQTLRNTELVNTEDDPGFAVGPSSAIIPDGAGGILLAPASFFLQAARVMSTTNQALTGTPTIDGVALGSLDRVLLTGQTDPTQNGLWQLPASSGAWSRPIDFQSSAELFTGLMVPVAQGSTHAGQLWQLSTAGPFVLGTTALTFAHVGAFATVFQTIGPATLITGGAADFLSVHGSERGVQRQPGETVEAYRRRIRNIPDAVAPVAISQSVLQLDQVLGLPPVLILEPFDLGETPTIKQALAFASFAAPALDSGDFLDDPSSGLILFDRRIATNYMQIQLQDYVTDPNGYEMFLDDGSYCDDPVLGFPDDVNQLPAVLMSYLLALVQDVYQKRSGGVNFDLFLLGDSTVVGEGSSSSASATKVFDLAPASGQIWYVHAGFAGHDCATPSSLPNVSHYIVYDLEDGSHLQTAAYHGQDTQRLQIPTQRVTGIHGWVQSDGTGVGNLVAWFLIRSADT